MSERCDTCRFWDVTDDSYLNRVGHPDDKEGFCRRHAPVPFGSNFQYEVLRHLTNISWEVVPEDEREVEFKDWEDSAHYGRACWPQTRGSDWCGEHQAKEMQ